MKFNECFAIVKLKWRLTDQCNVENLEIRYDMTEEQKNLGKRLEGIKII